jgi:pilus assembly protein CpaF
MSGDGKSENQLSIRARLAQRRGLNAPAPPRVPTPAPVTARAGTGAVTAQPQQPATSSGAHLTPALQQLKASIHQLLLERHADEELDVADRSRVRSMIAALADTFVRANQVSLSRLDYDNLIDSLLDDVLGLGPLEHLLNDPEISEIMVNNPRQVFVERAGTITLSSVKFQGDQQLMQVIQRIVGSVGRRVDESSPMVDARLKDGSRVNVVLPPLVLNGPVLTIRKFSQTRLTAADLIGQGSASSDMVDYLRAAVRSRLSVIVSGGTSSGKTTLLNVMSGFIPESERIITIEDAAELQLELENLITMESRPANVESSGTVTIRDLVRNALRMRPDRIIVGECRGGEALDMLQAMNTGHEGSLSTVHANSPKDALGRLETMALMAGADLPAEAIIRQIGAAVDVIVQVQRMRGGRRRIVSIAEVTGMSGGEIQLQDLFVFNQVGISADGQAIGYHTATGARSHFNDHFEVSGEEVSDSMFAPAPQPTVTRPASRKPHSQDVR